MLAANRFTSVTPEVNLRECVMCIPPPSTNKVAHSGFEIQSRHVLPEVQNRGISDPTKTAYVLKKLFKK